MDAGNKLAVVLLPGLNGTARLLEGVRARLAERRPASIIAYPTDQKLGYAQLTQLVQERLPPGRCIVLGESFSGPIAIQVAANSPERVAGLILAVSFARSPMPMTEALARFWMRSQLPRPLWAMAAGLMGRFATPKLKRALGEALADVPASVVAFRVDEAMRVDRLAQLAEVACPVLYIRGKHDWLLGSGPMREVQRTAKDFWLEEIEGPHMLLATHAAEAAERIEQFCSALPAPTLP